MSKKTIALIGTGTIGQKIAEELANHLSEHYTLIGMMKQSVEGINDLEKIFKTKVFTDFSELLSLKPDFIIEAASVEVVKAYGQEILKQGIHLIPLSVGALADQDFYKTLQETAEANNSILYIPSGAIGGFDLMRKMTLADQPEVEINTYKAPESLEGAPWLKDHGASSHEKEVVFDGPAAEAITGFPQNINVAVALALATVGPENVRTIIHSIPELEANVHEISIENNEGTADIRFVAKPSDNVRTSSITPWSVIALLKNIADPVRFF